MHMKFYILEVDSLFTWAHWMEQFRNDGVHGRQIVEQKSDGSEYGRMDKSRHKPFASWQIFMRAPYWAWRRDKKGEPDKHIHASNILESLIPETMELYE